MSSACTARSSQGIASNCMHWFGPIYVCLRRVALTELSRSEGMVMGLLRGSHYCENGAGKSESLKKLVSPPDYFPWGLQF